VPDTKTIEAMAKTGLDVKYLQVSHLENITELAADLQKNDDVILIKSPGESFSTDFLNEQPDVWDIAPADGKRSADTVKDEIDAHVRKLALTASP